MSRGHRLVDVLNEYPISTVRALAKAANANRIYDTLTFSNVVAVGAVHAIEAGFSGKTPQALKKYQQALLRGIKRQQSKGQGQDQDAQALFGGFTGKAVVEKTGHGRRKDKSGSST